MHGVLHRRKVASGASHMGAVARLRARTVATRRECAVTSLCELAALYQHTKAGHGTSWRQLTQEQRRVFFPWHRERSSESSCGGCGVGSACKGVWTGLHSG